MLSAAASNRLTAPSTRSSSPRFDPSSSTDSSTTSSTTPTRQSKRLSRITPSEFDSLLFNNPTETIKTTTSTLDEDHLGDTSITPPITPEKPHRDDLKRRSIYRSVGNASSPDLASLVRKHREQQQQQQLLSQQDQQEGLVLSDEDEEEGQREGEGEYDIESPTKQSSKPLQTTSSPILLPYPSPTLSSTTNSTSTATTTQRPPSSIRSRSTTSPEISLHEFAKQSSPSSPQPERQPIFSSPSFATRAREPTSLSTDSNLSTNSSGFVHVPSPSPASPSRTLSSTVQALKSQRQLQTPPPPPPTETQIEKRPSNRSTTSLISTFGLDFGTGQLPLGATSVSSPNSSRRKKASNGQQEEEGTKMSLGNTMRKTSRFFRKFGGGTSSNGPPPALNNSVSSRPTQSTSSSHQPPPTLSAPPPVPPIPSTYTSPPRPSLPQSQSPVTPRPTTASSQSQSMSRDPSAQSFNSTLSSSPSHPAPILRRRRSSSVPAHSQSPEKDKGRISGEGDRLKNELRMWRLGVDGVLGGTGENSPEKEKVGGGEKRKLSLPEGSLRGEKGKSMERGGSLPLPPPMSFVEKEKEGEGLGFRSLELAPPAQETPKIRLVSPTTTFPTPTPPTTFDTLSSIPESSHSRETSSATTIHSTPQSPSSSPSLNSSDSSKFPLPLPFASPPLIHLPTSRSPLSANKSRISIVGYPSSSGHSRSPATSYLSSPSTSSTPTIRPPEEGSLKEKARELSRKCWEEDESFLERRKIASYLGSAGELNKLVLEGYVERFEFNGLRLDLAFRKLCGKLYLKAETQQVDRILESFSRKYFIDNPKSPYSSADIVHAVSYSLLLLNTDLHVVESGSVHSKMTRGQFVKNTLNAISLDQGTQSPSTGGGGEEDVFSPTLSEYEEGGLGTIKGSPNQSRITLGGGGGTDSPGRIGAGGLGMNQRSESNLTVASSSTGTTMASSLVNKSFEINLTNVLKEMYNSIRSQPIYQSSSISSSSALNLPLSPSDQSRPSLSLTPGNSPYSTWSTTTSGGGVNRTASSRRSATSSANSSQIFGGSSNGNKRNSMSMRGLLGGGGGGTMSSLDLVRSTSPTPSNGTSLSDEQWSTAFGASHFQNTTTTTTIGFANSLSHTIIREQQEEPPLLTGGDNHSIASSSISISDEELALLGAPWAKEGMLSRKHYWESTNRRSKDKNWLKCFVVVSQGELKGFRFDGGGGGGSTRGGGGAGGGGMGMGIGGGDWTSNASDVGSISLIHSLCSSMPPPGYSRDRPHCFVLTLPNGGSYFFQAGTPDLVSEWVSTCNYWSARLSREPLSGGVSNVEYGWNRIEGSKFDHDSNDGGARASSVKSGKSGHSRMSYAASTFGGAGGTLDRIRIEEWKPPNVPLTPSQLAEEAQLDHLKKHVEIVRKELEEHNELRTPMTKLYSSRSSNYAKALGNWERKSQHLLTEIVKWSTYIEALTSAVRLRSIQRGKKEVEAMLKSADSEVEEDEDDDELVSRLSPFDEMPPSSTNSTTPTTANSNLRLNDGAAEGSRRSSLARRESEDKEKSSRSVSRVSVTTTSTRGGGDEFYDSNTTPPV